MLNFCKIPDDFGEQWVPLFILLKLLVEKPRRVLYRKAGNKGRAEWISWEVFLLAQEYQEEGIVENMVNNPLMSEYMINESVVRFSSMNENVDNTYELLILDISENRETCAVNKDIYEGFENIYILY